MNKKSKKAIKEISIAIIISLIGILLGLFYYDNTALYIHENAHKYFRDNCTISYTETNNTVLGDARCDGVRHIALEGIVAELLVGLLIMATPLSAFSLVWFFMLGYKVLFIPQLDFTGLPYVFNIILGLILMGLMYISIDLQIWWIKKLEHKLKN